MVALVGLAVGVLAWRLQPTDARATYKKADGSPTGFRDVSPEAGISFRMRFLPNEQGQVYKANLYDHGCGLAIGDYDGDGKDDVYFLNQMGQNALYRNRGDGTFEDQTEAARVGLGDRICVGAVMADYDNDGDQDLYVTSTRGGNVLFRNQGDGTFQDVTEKAGVKYVGHSQTPLFFDPDRDGDLDLIVTNTAAWTTEEFISDARYYVGRDGLVALAQSPRERNVFFRNNGDGTFTEATQAAGLQGLGWGGDVAAFDYDEDGWIDLFITNMFGKSQLYHNQGKGVFRDVTSQTLGRTSWGAIGAKPFDYDGDGRLDLYVTDMHSDMWMDYRARPESIEEHRKYAYVTGGLVGPGRGSYTEMTVARDLAVNYSEVIFGNTLFHNQGKGQFEEVSDRAGVETFWPWGIAVGDFDNDGDVDAFVPSGMGYPFFYWRNYLLMNGGQGAFTDRSREEGIEPPRLGRYQLEKIAGRAAARSSRCAAAADFDGDGRVDLIVNNFNDAPAYFKNQFPRQGYIEFALRGTRSNRDAIGALLRLHAGNRVYVRQVNAAGGYLTCESKVVHFGLGDAKQVDRVEIRWPSGSRQVLTRPQINMLHSVREEPAP